MQQFGHRSGLQAAQRRQVGFGLPLQALQILLPTPDNQRLWLRNANSGPAFNGQTPLDRLLGGQVADLYVVRSALDGHLCRCGAHNRIVRAVLRASREKTA